MHSAVYISVVSGVLTQWGISDTDFGDLQRMSGILQSQQIGSTLFAHKNTLRETTFVSFYNQTLPHPTISLEV